MTRSRRSLLSSLLLFQTSLLLQAQNPAAGNASGNKAEPDVLTFVNGEKLIGHFERSQGSLLTFKSDMAGEVTVEWSKVKELHSAHKFAVVKNDEKVRWRHPVDVPQGTISVTDQKIEVSNEQHSASTVLPLNRVSQVIEQAAFDKAVFEKPGIFEDWKGSATVGISLVNATQSSQTYTSAASVERILPAASWLDPSNRTTLNFNSAYGQLKQPATPLVKTSLFHASAERDEYFHPRLYGFGSAGFDHDYSQGLDLQQIYGGGVGWTVSKRPNQEFDLKGELTFVNQQFFDAAQNQKLLGSIFSETYDHRFRKRIVLHEQISINPAWTILRAYSANGIVNLSMPILKGVSFTVSTADQFLNDPSPGFRKNSYQFSTGLTYTLP